jgi:hypothetical protein
MVPGRTGYLEGTLVGLGTGNRVPRPSMVIFMEDNSQQALIDWLSKNGIKVPEGVADPDAVFIKDGIIHFNLDGLNEEGVVTIEAEVPLAVDPPAHLNVCRS